VATVAAARGCSTSGTLKRIFRAHGIRLYPDHDYCFGCHDQSVVWALSNTPSGLPHEDADRASASHGFVSCDVLAKDVFGRRIARYVWRNDDDPTYVEVLNIECAISPNSRRDTDELERATRQLPRVSTQPTTGPSEDAVHD
jgi:hypothetical protein